MAQSSTKATEKKLLGGEVGAKTIWDEAAENFKEICGESLLRGDVKSFDDVKEMIESSRTSRGLDPEQKEKWEKAKSVGLESLKYLKKLVVVATKASSFAPIPAGIADVTSYALCFVFEIPVAIKRYHDAINDVFGKVSTALSQFQVYDSMNSLDASLDGLLVQEIGSVMLSVVKLCAHVVKYRQGSWLRRLRQDVKSIFDEDSGLSDEMTTFKDALQRLRDIEGTITLAQVVDTRKGMKSVNDDTDRRKTLEKLRDCLNVPSTCCNGTGQWIPTHAAYREWTEAKYKETSHVLVVSGPPSSGKTTATAMIIKRLEEKRDRTYVAHYFFPASAKRSEDDRESVWSALKYMAFQIARVDDIVRNALSKACDAGAVLLSGSGRLDDLWANLHIGATGQKTTYYMIFEGVENLPDDQADMLFNLLYSSKLAGQSAARVRVLLSMTDDKFMSAPSIRNALRIRMEQQNSPDMSMIIEEKLNGRGLLQNVKPGSDRHKAKNKVLERLPQNVNGSYSLLKFAMENVIRILSTRTAMQELDNMLTQSINSHEVAIKELQRSLTGEEISELNELLKWVRYSKAPLNLDQLEAAMFLYSDVKSPLASLQYIITNKYPAVLRLEDGFVYGQDDIIEYIEKKTKKSRSSSQHAERPTISMTISINNVGEENCEQFLWDLADQAIRHKFKFDLEALDSRHHTIAVDEFEAHHSIVTRAFDYLNMDHTEQTRIIGSILVSWLPYHLNRLRQLEDADEGTLKNTDKLKIGDNLYKLFGHSEVFARHIECFKPSYWTEEEIGQVMTWLMDSSVVRKVNAKWLSEVRRTPNPVRGFLKELVKVVVTGLLRERSWAARNAYGWIKELMKVDETYFTEDRNANIDDADFSDDFHWHKVSKWCQEYLALPNSGVDSLWYERLAEAASSQGSKPEFVLSLYQTALSREKPSWLCYRGIGETYFRLGLAPKAIERVEKALENAEQDGATPEPEKKDIANLHLVLGEYAYKAEAPQKAADHYQQASMSDDENQVRRGQLGHLKATFNFPNLGVKRELLQCLLTERGEEAKLVGVLKMIARDGDYDAIMSKIFAASIGDQDLLKSIVQAMETATTTPPVRSEDQTTEMSSDARFAENQTRGVLLYYRGVAAYKYKIPPAATEPISAAMRLWGECRDQLSDVGGSNASAVRQDAIRELAKHYFQSMLDGNHLDNVDKLSELAEADSNLLSTDPSGLLGSLYAIRHDQTKSRAMLERRMRHALQILSDDVPENDAAGFYKLFCTLAQYADLKNTAIAMSLWGQPDYLTEALLFQAQDLVDVDHKEKHKVLNMVTKLAQETIKIVKAKFPDPSQQLQRIQAAIEHAELLLASMNGMPKTKESHGGIDPTSLASTTTIAHRYLQDRLSSLHRSHTLGLNKASIDDVMVCNGRRPDGKRCKSTADFKTELFHCTYCSNKNFCGDCLKRLRDPQGCVGITACSANHRWLRVPPLGQDMYVGPRARTARVPSKVIAMDMDEKILEVEYAEHGEEREITVEVWKQTLADEWDIRDS